MPYAGRFNTHVVDGMIIYYCLEWKENEPCLYYCTEKMMKEAMLEQLAMMCEETDDPEEIDRMDKVYKDITSKEPSDRAKDIIDANIKEVKFTTL